MPVKVNIGRTNLDYTAKKYQIKNSSLLKRRANVAFKGASTPPRGIEHIGRLDGVSTWTTLFSTVGCGIARPLITLVDKKTPWDERVYSAAWQFGISAAGLGILAATSWGKAFKVVGSNLVKPFFKKAEVKDIHSFVDLIKPQKQIEALKDVAAKVTNGKSTKELTKELNALSNDVAKYNKNPQKYIDGLYSDLNDKQVYEAIFNDKSGKVIDLVSGKTGKNIKGIIENLNKESDDVLKEQVLIKELFRSEGALMDLVNNKVKKSTIKAKLINDDNFLKGFAKKLLNSDNEKLKNIATNVGLKNDNLSNGKILKKILHDDELQDELIKELAKKDSSSQFGKTINDLKQGLIDKDKAEIEHFITKNLEKTKDAKEKAHYEAALKDLKNNKYNGEFSGHGLNDKIGELKAERLGHSIKDTSFMTDMNAVVGGSKWADFVLQMVTMTAGTWLVTKYLGRVLDSFKKDKDGKPIGDQRSPEQKAEDKSFNEKLLTAVALLGAGLGIKKGISVWKTMAKKGADAVAEKVAEKTTKYVKSETKKSRLKKWMAKQSSHKGGDSWVERAVITNLGLRLLITIPTGQYYNVVRCVVDEMLGLSLLTVNTPVVKAAKKHTNRILNTSYATAHKFRDIKLAKKGSQFVTNEGIKNFGIVAVVMGFANNLVSPIVHKALGKMLGEKHDPEKTEKQYTELKKRLPNIPVTKLDRENNLNMVDSNAFNASNNPEKWMKLLDKSNANKAV